jgi:thioester reductase-like protein
MSDLQQRLANLSATKLAFLSQKIEGQINLLKAEPIAVISVACRFPGGSNSPEAYWQMLEQGREGIKEVPKERWDIAKYYDPEPLKSGKMQGREAAFLDSVDQFDPQFFGITPREILNLDPQQRLLLEVAWEALERGNQAPEKLTNTATGVFIGISSFDYSMKIVDEPIDPKYYDAYLVSGNALSMAAGRLSFLLGLTGPAFAVDTACSSSLLSVHLACQSLRYRECHLALAGGVNILLSPINSVCFSQSGMMSKDSRCYSFEARANGYVRGEGCGIVVLKRLGDALRDRDNILGVIRGSAVNQNGQRGAVFIPNRFAQQSVIREALQNAGITPDQVSYLEANALGLPLSDPIEMAAIAEVFTEKKASQKPLFVSSIKTNIGNLEAAGGISALIKVILALQHRKIPSHLNFQTPSPLIEWSKVPFVKIPTQTVDWQVEQERIAGISSFGLSGTNVHLILEEAPYQEKPLPSITRPYHLLALSAKTQPALKALAKKYQSYFAQVESSSNLGDICYSTNIGRNHFPCRLAVVGNSISDIQRQLDKFLVEQHNINLNQDSLNIRPPKLVFCFQELDKECLILAQQLYETSPSFQEYLQGCDLLFISLLGKSILAPFLETKISPQLLTSAIAKPLIFSLLYGLAKLWLGWGIMPSAMLGDGVGEYVAACLSGLMTLEDSGRLLLAQNDDQRVEILKRIKFSNPTIQFIPTRGHQGLSAATGEYWSVLASALVSATYHSLNLEKYDYLIQVSTQFEIKNPANLTSFTLANSDNNHGPVWLVMLNNLAQLYTKGIKIDWVSYDQDYTYQKLILPTYPFQRQRYWREGQLPQALTPLASSSPILELIQQADSQKLQQVLAKTGTFSAEQIALLPQLLETLIDLHQSPAPRTIQSEILKTFEQTPDGDRLTFLMTYLQTQIQPMVDLSLPALDPQQSLLDLGLNSMKATEIILSIYEDLQLNLSIESLLDQPTLAGLATLILTNLNTKIPPQVEKINLQAEVVLETTIVPEFLDRETVFPLAQEPRTILLTGATGFLGAFLLSELLQQTPAKIYCLVRGKDEEEARLRLQNNLKTYKLWRNTYDSQIIPILGNLAEPLMGLSSEKFNQLASEIDVIYHNGAQLSYVHSYAQLKATNVIGTKTVLGFAVLKKIKPMHFVSSVAVFEASAYEGKVLTEWDPILESEGICLGYSQSKWVAERLVWLAGQRGLPITIYRPGLISGDSQTGISNTDDFFIRMIQGCLQLGFVPDLPLPLNFSPVDYVAKAIAYLSRQNISEGKVFHLQNPAPLLWSEYQNFTRTQGIPLETVSYPAWVKKLKDPQQKQNPLFPLLPFFMQTNSDGLTYLERVASAQAPQIDCRVTVQALAHSGIVCPAFEDLFKSYLAYFIRSGLLISDLPIVRRLSQQS